MVGYAQSNMICFFFLHKDKHYQLVLFVVKAAVTWQRSKNWLHHDQWCIKQELIMHSPLLVRLQYPSALDNIPNDKK